MVKNAYVCVACAHEQPTLDPCRRCGSISVVAIEVVKEMFGDDWKKLIQSFRMFEQKPLPGFEPEGS